MQAPLTPSPGNTPLTPKPDYRRVFTVALGVCLVLFCVHDVIVGASVLTGAPKELGVMPDEHISRALAVVLLALQTWPLITFVWLARGVLRYERESYRPLIPAVVITHGLTVVLMAFVFFISPFCGGS